MLAHRIDARITLLDVGFSARTVSVFATPGNCLSMTVRGLEKEAVFDQTASYPG